MPEKNETVEAALDLVETAMKHPVETAAVVVEAPVRLVGAVLEGLLGL